MAKGNTSTGNDESAFVGWVDGLEIFVGVADTVNVGLGLGVAVVEGMGEDV